MKISKNSIITGKLSGIEHMPAYRHDNKSLSSLMKELNVNTFKIEIIKFGGRDRLFLIFWKR